MKVFQPRHGIRKRATHSQSLVDQALGLLGLARIKKLRETSVLIEGHVYATFSKNGVVIEEHYLGQNVVNNLFRNNVAGLIARPKADTDSLAPAPVDYISDQGYDTTSDILPIWLGVGVGTTAATTDDVAMESPLYAPGPGAQVFYPLKRIFYDRDETAYAPDPIHCAFFFDIPSGESYENPVGGGATNNVTITEWALFDSDAIGSRNMLAHKIATISKLSELDLTIRWEIRT